MSILKVTKVKPELYQMLDELKSESDLSFLKNSGCDPYTCLLVSRLANRIIENPKHEIYKTFFDAVKEVI